MADFCVMRTSEADITVNGDIRIDANNVGIATESTELYDGSFTLAQGIYGRHRGTGDVDITARGGFITTKGRSSYGMRGDHGHRITTTGANAHGIVAYHYFGTEDDRSIDVTVGGRIDTSGARQVDAVRAYRFERRDPRTVAVSQCVIDSRLRVTMYSSRSVHGVHLSFRRVWVSSSPHGWPGWWRRKCRWPVRAVCWRLCWRHAGVDGGRREGGGGGRHAPLHRKPQRCRRRAGYRALWRRRRHRHRRRPR